MAIIAEVILAFAPAPLIEAVPALGRILRLLAPLGGLDPGTAAQTMEEVRKKGEDERKTRIKRNGRYVLKASDAMQCVDDALSNGLLLFALGKSIFRILTRLKPGADSAVDILEDKIFACIESKVLSQKNPRTVERINKFGRPAKGHGHGRPHLKPGPK